MKYIYKTLMLLIFWSFLAFPCISNAQKVRIQEGENQFDLLQADDQSLHFQSRVASFTTMEVNTKAGMFSQLFLAGYNHSVEEGAPKLPVLKKLIEVPHGADFEIKYNNLKVETIGSDKSGINFPVFPVQPPVPKSGDPESQPFVIDEEIYRTNNWYGQEIVRVIDLGIMRGVRIARLEIAPFMYNPVNGNLQIIRDFNCEISFKGANPAHTKDEKARVYSPWFEANFSRLINHDRPEHQTGAGDAIIEAAPVTYIIVSDPMFQATLQPFIQWKTKKGYRVVEAYTNDPAVGSSAASIKNYLKSFYQNPPEGYNPQSFVLIVGDVAQVPAFNGSAGSHVTDLYYCEYTNDIFPECFYGRFSATNLSHLQAQIDKTLEYEQYTFPDPSFLDEVVMVAGADASHQLTWGNGQINYGTQYYFNAAHGLYSHTYLQPEPSGGNYSYNIRQDVSNGVAYANYSAHCSPSGWANPSFTISNISALTNSHRYPLMVGNCCSSVEFQTTCFGEEILRAPLKGAIGYIGGSNSTYWDEDFWWGVGLENISANPTYNSSHLGAYDRTFHDQSGITTNDWFITQGQMPSAGNLAVSQSGSSLENYYWEIYHLMGDPSLMVYFSQPPDITASYPGMMPVAATSFTINTEPFAYVAISKDGLLHGAALANSSGVAEVSLTPVTEPGEADVVITGQNLKPFQGTVMVATPEGAFVVLENFTIDDAATGNANGLADYGETFALDIEMKNQGTTQGDDITLLLSTESEYMTILQPEGFIQQIEPGEIIALNDVFEMTLTENVPDGETISFFLEATDGTGTWESTFNLMTHAPALEYTETVVSDPAGNGNGKIDPGETASLLIGITNTGTSEALAVSGILTSSNTYISIISDDPQAFGNVLPDGSATAGFEVFCHENTPSGENIDFTLDLSGNMGITGQASFSLVAGQIPVLVVDLDENNNSAIEIAASIDEIGVAAEITTTFPANPELYSSLFVCLGIYSNNHVLSTAQGQILADYLTAGGNLYMEGGDTWSYDSQTAVHPMFGINGISDGSGDLGTILGVNGTMTGGMSYSYSGDNNWIDRLEATGGGTLILTNQSPAYGCGVINEQNNYKTIGTSFEFGGLSTERTALMEQFLIFFDLLPSLTANFTTDATDISTGESVAFSNASAGNPISFLWNFEGGTPNQSTVENPVITYHTPGTFDVTLTISDGADTASLTRNNLITVNSTGSTQYISVAQGWSGISGCMIPENPDLNVIFNANLDDVVVMQTMNGIFYPEFQVNTIGEWDYQTGYLIKAENPFTIALHGSSPDVLQITLKQGWNLMPVLSDCDVSIGSLFGLYLDKVAVMKSIAGTEVFWPVYNINTLGKIQTGRAYYIFVTEDITITFPECN